MKYIDGCGESYKITEDGEVWSCHRLIIHKVLKNNIIKRGGHFLKKRVIRGYYKHCLSVDGKVYDIYTHRIVASAFVENKDNKPFVNHIDGNKLNNHYTNLEWVTSSENMKHAYNAGLLNCEAAFKKGSQNISSKLKDSDVIQIKDLLRNEIPVYLISCLFNVSTTSIYKIKLGQQWSHIK